jgi:hypothetical protein
MRPESRPRGQGRQRARVGEKESETRARINSTTDPQRRDGRGRCCLRATVTNPLGCIHNTMCPHANQISKSRSCPELIEFIASGSGPKFADLRVQAPVVYLPTVDQRTFHRSSDGEESGKMDLLGGYWV